MKYAGSLLGEEGVGYKGWSGEFVTRDHIIYSSPAARQSVCVFVCVCVCAYVFSFCPCFQHLSVFVVRWLGDAFFHLCD